MPLNEIKCHIPHKALEKAPLYKPISVPDLNQKVQFMEIGFPSITMECDKCDSTQTYTSIASTIPSNCNIHDYNIETSVRLIYHCAKCRTTTRHFMIYISSHTSTIIKIGQYPPHDVRGDRTIEKLLGDRRQFLRRAMICEAQSYGIAAYSYYRRIVELIIDDLVKDLRIMIPAGDLPNYEDGLRRVEASHHASDKIAIAKDLLPVSLCPNGENPLGTLHKTLSNGIHSFDDEECLIYAGEIRTILTFLIRQIHETKTQLRDYTTAMKALHARK